jgi:hypothetical protein
VFVGVGIRTLVKIQACDEDTPNVQVGFETKLSTKSFRLCPNRSIAVIEKSGEMGWNSPREARPEAGA